ncbi:YcxB family protein [uncultured Xanthomonas sp.]|uniref:YcxB family protein n=1 Tax=uncultured Xanthomonas sp. TaxID=152831 RepID=UPI0037488148
MISGNIRLDDYRAAQRLHYRYRLRRALIVAGVAFVLGVGLLLFTAPGSLASMLGTLLLGVGCGGPIWLGLWYGWVLPSRLLFLYAQQEQLQHRYTYAWDEAGMRMTWPNGEVRRRWRDYVRYRESPQVLLLYHDASAFDVVPTSWFADAAQRDAFRQLVAAQVCTEGGKRTV